MTGRPMPSDISNEAHDLAARLLDEQGYVSELDPPYAKNILQFCRDAIEQKARELGYSGGALDGTAPEVESGGWIWVVYDTERYEREEINMLVKRRVARLNRR